MAQADLDEDTPAAWRLLLAEMLRVAQAVHDAHLARSESRAGWPPGRRGTEGPGDVRARLGSLEALRAELLAVVEPAQEEVGTRTGGGCEASAPTGGQRCAAARAVRRADNGAGTAETVPRKWGGEHKVCCDERAGRSLLPTYLVDAAWQMRDVG